MPRIRSEHAVMPKMNNRFSQNELKFTQKQPFPIAKNPNLFYINTYQSIS